MAVRTASLTNSLDPVSTLEDLSKLELSLTDDYDEPHSADSVGWCGGDFTGDVQEASDAGSLRDEIKFKINQKEPSDAASLRDEIKFKDTLIDELQKSNHELRMKFAEAETKIAQMRVKIDSHCECCARNMGVEESAERKKYTSNDWSSTHSFGMDFAYFSPPAWNKEVIKAPEDNTNPYVKVRRWQDTLPGEVTRETDSTSSSYILKRSPNCVPMRSGNTRPESPATSGNVGDYILIPMGNSSPSSGFRGFDNADDSRPGSPQKLSLFRRDQQPSGCGIEEETPSSLLPTVKSSPDERLYSRQQRFKSHTSAPSAVIRSQSSPRDYENHETQGMDRYKQAVIRTMQSTWVQHENHTHLSIWNRPNNSGIVGSLMRDNNRK